MSGTGLSLPIDVRNECPRPEKSKQIYTRGYQYQVPKFQGYRSRSCVTRSLKGARIHRPIGLLVSKMDDPHLPLWMTPPGRITQFTGTVSPIRSWEGPSSIQVDGEGQGWKTRACNIRGNQSISQPFSKSFNSV